MKRLVLLVTAAAAFALLAMPAIALARSHDRNHDGIPDKWERHFHLSLKHNQARRDPDHDGLTNKQEFKAGTNPRDADTDNDGLDDGDEVKTANDPTDGDTDNNGVEDGNENSGHVASFDSSTGTLVIDLGDNHTVTGQVTNATEIECRTAQEQEVENENEAENENDAEHHDDTATAAHDGESGDSSSGEGDRQQGTTCGTSDLTPGTTVHEAELEVENGSATFEKVELLK